MALAIAVTETPLVVQYDVSVEAIAQLAEDLAGVTFDTPEKYKDGVKKIAQVRGMRTAVEKRRKDLKASSLEFGRKVDAAARTLTDRLEAIETPLLAAKKAVDDEDERLKKEKERADLIALEAKLKADREAAEAAAKLIREADEKQIAEERARLDAAGRRSEAEANKAMFRRGGAADRARAAGRGKASARREAGGPRRSPSRDRSPGEGGRAGRETAAQARGGRTPGSR